MAKVEAVNLSSALGLEALEERCTKESLAQSIKVFKQTGNIDQVDSTDFLSISEEGHCFTVQTRKKLARNFSENKWNALAHEMLNFSIKQ